MNKKIYSFFNRLLITCVITLSILILTKKSETFKTKFYNAVYETNIKFSKINEIYKENFGDIIPFEKLLKDNTKPVFNEKIEYETIEPYLDGAHLKVANNYLVKAQNNGLVIFIGNKEGYGNTVIIEDKNGINTWYSNIKNINVKLYEYVKEGTLIGDVEKDLYMVYKKDGKILDYKTYIY